MKRFFAIALGAVLAFGVASPTLAGGDGCGGCDGEKKAGEGEKAKDGCGGCDETAKAEDGCGGCDGMASTKALEQLRSMAGDWEGTDADKDGQPDVRVTYKVTANGSAVVETIMPGTPHEMITVYTVDAEGKLMLTHYCAMGNQPRMRATSTEGNTVKFEFVDGTNCDPAKGFMGGLTMTFEGEKVKQEWAVLKDGKTVQTIAFELTRAKKAAK